MQGQNDRYRERARGSQQAHGLEDISKYQHLLADEQVPNLISSNIVLEDQGTYLALSQEGHIPTKSRQLKVRESITTNPDVMSSRYLTNASSKYQVRNSNNAIMTASMRSQFMHATEPASVRHHQPQVKRVKSASQGHFGTM